MTSNLRDFIINVLMIFVIFCTLIVFSLPDTGAERIKTTLILLEYFACIIQVIFLFIKPTR